MLGEKGVIRALQCELDAKRVQVRLLYHELQEKAAVIQGLLAASKELAGKAAGNNPAAVAEHRTALRLVLSASASGSCGAHPAPLPATADLLYGNEVAESDGE